MDFELDKVFQHIIAHRAHADFNRSPGTGRFDLPADLNRGPGTGTLDLLLLRELLQQVFDCRGIRIDVQGSEFVP